MTQARGDATDIHVASSLAQQSSAAGVCLQHISTPLQQEPVNHTLLSSVIST